VEVSVSTALEYDKYYHVYNRGNNRDDIFHEARNYPYFLQLYVKYIEPIADTFAYCLLRNHFHLFIRTKTIEEQHTTFLQTFDVSKTSNVSIFNPKDPSDQFRIFFNTYAKAFNKAYGRTGGLFENPFKRVEVTGDGYFTQLVVYLHRNPEKHGLVDDFRHWTFSSYQAILSNKPTRVQRDEVLAWFGGVKWFEDAHLSDSDERQIAHLIEEEPLDV
jgi:hypothetical protein